MPLIPMYERNRRDCDDSMASSTASRVGCVGELSFTIFYFFTHGGVLVLVFFLAGVFVADPAGATPRISF